MLWGGGRYHLHLRRHRGCVGATWEVEQRGLHALHCSAVAFAGNHILVSAGADPFAPQNAIYRRGVDERGPLVPVPGGLPEWLEGIVHTLLRMARRPRPPIGRATFMYVSTDSGRACRAEGTQAPSSIRIVVR